MRRAAGSVTTTAATQAVRCSSVSPPRLSMSRISSVAYALDDRGSLQNTGSASFFGSSVSPRRSLLIGRPTRKRYGNSSRVFFTAPANGFPRG
jgi:hypothetical protein